MKLTGKLFFSLFWLGIFCSLALSLPAKGQTAAANEKFRLIHSDKLFLSNVNGENILELFGNVHFFYGNTEFYSNRATIFNTQKIARLIGNVKVSNDTINVRADSISYYRIPDKLSLGGNVIITEQKKKGLFNTFNCNAGSYDKANDIVTATGKVTGYSEEEKVRGSCNYAYWDRKNGYGYMIEQPELWSEDKDSLNIKSGKMEFFDADHKVIATFEVQAKTKDYLVTSDFLLYFLKEDKAIFQGEPRFDSDFAEAEATEFYLYLRDRKLSGAELKDSCIVYFAEERGRPKINWVKADFITMNFNDDYLKDFTAENQVTYYYKQEKTEEKDFFSNNAAGDFLSALFNSNGKLDIMHMRNKITGVYRFENTKTK